MPSSYTICPGGAGPCFFEFPPTQASSFFSRRSPREESTAAVNNLAKETASLFEMLSRFQMADRPANTKRVEEPAFSVAAA
ncbi:hypothetical protein CCGE531_33970 (plasmid) [Rhizobium sp. CCGE531]|nr:hypothetical protein CCGE531_33970 [Rhizobium sp. CCGE531]AYG77300.1 hypothetical protein CCGE532_33125 [Rhizobium sp. CCGE532]